MIFTLSDWAAMAEGKVTLTLRRWANVRIKPGSRVRSSLGVVEITSVDAIATITDSVARAAGFANAADALATVDKKSLGGSLYRIGLRYVGEDPRRRLRDDNDLDEQELDDLRRRLARMDRAEPWTRAYLELIAANPGAVSRELAPQVGVERDIFKIKVRRLKDLGLTESLEVGYRISPRGQAFLDADTV